MIPGCDLGAWGCQNLRGYHQHLISCSFQRQTQGQPTHYRDFFFKLLLVPLQGMGDISSPTRDQTCASCIGNAKP